MLITLLVQVGFGKGTPSKMLWVDGIDPDMSESVLERSMTKYGKVLQSQAYLHVCIVCIYNVHAHDILR